MLPHGVRETGAGLDGLGARFIRTRARVVGIDDSELVVTNDNREREGAGRRAAEEGAAGVRQLRARQPFDMA